MNSISASVVVVVVVDIKERCDIFHPCLSTKMKDLTDDNHCQRHHDCNDDDCVGLPRLVMVMNGCSSRAMHDRMSIASSSCFSYSVSSYFSIHGRNCCAARRMVVQEHYLAVHVVWDRQ
jgi:hypothetical protein